MIYLEFLQQKTKLKILVLMLFQNMEEYLLQIK